LNSRAKLDKTSAKALNEHLPNGMTKAAIHIAKFLGYCVQPSAFANSM